MRQIDVVTDRAVQALDVTDLITVQQWSEGWLVVTTPHTTAALMLGESDPEMLDDYEKVAVGLPGLFQPFKHHRNDNPNAAAHVVSSLAGTQLLLPIVGGRVMLGTWQRIIFLELDGPKKRTISCGVVAAAGD
jgi:secondary thiamine-phosphate synthase enzyme